MNFLPDVFIQCDVCHGKRFNEDVLSVIYKGYNITQVLDTPIEDIKAIFEENKNYYLKLYNQNSHLNYHKKLFLLYLQERDFMGLTDIPATFA